MTEKLKEMITQYVEVNICDIKEDSRFAEDLGFNSYDIMCMLGDIEDEFDIEIDEIKAFKNKTVGEMAEYLQELTA